MNGGVETEVRHSAERSQYELVVDGEVVGVAEYRRSGDTLVFPHTQITSSLRGQGLGALLVQAALDDVRASGGRVVPRCWYVAEFIDANPSYRDLLVA
jgi:predicted GNAT family acetyltransferase